MYIMIGAGTVDRDAEFSKRKNARVFLFKNGVIFFKRKWEERARQKMEI